MGMDITHTGAITIDPPIPHDEFLAANLPLRDVKPRVEELPVEGIPGTYRRVVTAIEPAMQVFSGYRVSEDLQLVADRFGEGRAFGGRIECSWASDGGGRYRHVVRGGRALEIKPIITWLDEPTSAQRVLDLPMQTNDAGAATIRDYLVELLGRVWEQDERFSGKRPFGNSGWTCELYEPLVRAGLVQGEFDVYGLIADIDDRAARKLITDAIGELRPASTGESGGGDA